MASQSVEIDICEYFFPLFLFKLKLFYKTMIVKILKSYKPIWIIYNSFFWRQIIHNRSQNLCNMVILNLKDIEFFMDVFI